MTYLYQPRKKSKKHIWNSKNNDTYCKMWSTGGLNKKKKWSLSDNVFGKQTCKMCKANFNK